MSTELELDELRALVERRAGIHLDETRGRFLAARVREHMQERNIAGAGELMARLRTSNFEYQALLERLLTQETSFFRYPSVFDALRHTILKEMHTRKFWEDPRTLRIWSAGCATGEEAYSIAMTIVDALMFVEAWDIEILATDISASALRRAEQAVYPRRALAGLSPEQVEAHFSPAPGPDEWQVRPRTRRLVRFAPMNLAEPVYAGRMDVIFCMNVMIYFTEERRMALVRKFYDALNPGGYLVLGHAESLAKCPVKLESVRHGDSLLYRKPLAEAKQPGARAVALEKTL
ncbi:MAG TPA: protein-glutamate O-methyltransferase CheR [Candidatus Acidoferrales bacterium]|nr:protein-glutamate O-methyltransferase CheR [Candidatus Acidoferrales bacterium]